MLPVFALAALLAEPSQEEPQDLPPPPPVEEVEEAWSVELALYAFGRPQDDVFLMPVAIADRGALHLELRYNYEDIDAGSVFVGRNFSFSGELELTVTPMLGLVGGSVEGVAPGLELDLSWRGFEFSSESEYFVGFGGDEDFLYTWSELTYSPADWLRFGLSAQRTRLFDQELWLDRGLLLGFTFEPVWIDLYLFNPDGDEPYGGVGLGVDF